MTFHSGKVSQPVWPVNGPRTPCMQSMKCNNTLFIQCATRSPFQSTEEVEVADAACGNVTLDK